MNMRDGLYALLRMAIGWHFLYEGVWKLVQENWSAKGFLQSSDWFADAIHPREGFPYAFNNGADAICVGMFDFQMVENVNLVNKIFAKGLPARKRKWN